MQNFKLIDKRTIELTNGLFTGVESYSCYQNGELEGVKLAERNILVTHLGELVPAYTETHRRKNKFSVEFYKTGTLRQIALNEVQDVSTPLGDLPAELVNFYYTGELRRVFPLDGQISGMWTEQEERALAIPITFDLPFAEFTAAVVEVAFHKEGTIRSITLFPGETVPVNTTFGEVKTRIGFSLYETGQLRSVEPSVPVVVQTPIGEFTAFDPNAPGVIAELNSLEFDEDGALVSLITIHNSVTVKTADRQIFKFSPRDITNPLDGESKITEGLKISFDFSTNMVTFIEHIDGTDFPLYDSEFTVSPYTPSVFKCPSADCSGCSLDCK